MTLYKFNSLSRNNKFQATWDYGQHIETILQNSLVINLYAVSKFFVEVYYDQNKNKIVDLKSFKQGHLLDKYSGPIPL